MRKLIACLFFTATLSVISYSQKASIKGTVTDTLEKKNIANAVIMITGKADSILIKFTRSDKDGNFLLNDLPVGKFILTVTYPAFADYTDDLLLTPNGNADLGTIALTPRSRILEEVIVRQNIAIRMKGDTIEFKADSFKVREGATVEDLLRKLPGLQVDRNGTITAQGQKVEKVLVDGEEFFSDDPAVVIKNLRADAIDKVQSFDKKSDQAEFTGIDDGTRSKTLNLVLKDDKKKGSFGKVSVAGGTRSRYANEAMVNYFKGKKKASVYGVMANTGKLGLGWEDRGKFGAGDDFGDATVEMSANSIVISGGSNEFYDGDPSFYGEGIPSALKAGAHFSNKWNREKNNVNGNYSIKQQNVSADGNSLTKNILPDSAYYFRENHSNHSRQMQQLISGSYDLQIDSFASVRLKINASSGNTKNEQFTISGSDNEDLKAVNRNTRDNLSDLDQKAFAGSILWRQKFRKVGRTLSVTASHKYNNKESTGFLRSHTDFYDSIGRVSASDSLDQYKRSNSLILTTQSRLVYTEPVGKKTILEFNYAINSTISTSDRKSFDKINGKYDALNPLFTNSYRLGFLSNSAGTKYQYNGKKIVANVGSNIGLSSYTQKDSTGREVRHYNYTNLFPNSRISYKISPQRSLNLTYTGTPQPPAIDQIQPIFENTDPLNIITGNPLLKQAFMHRVNLSFNDFKVLTGRSIYTNVNYYSTNNAIVSSQVTDKNGRRTLQYVNTTGNYNVSLNSEYGYTIKKVDIELSAGLGGALGQSVNFVNTIKNTNKNKRLDIHFSLNKYVEEKFSVRIYSTFSRNYSVSTINRGARTAYWIQYHYITADLEMIKKWVFGLDMDINIREKTDAFDNNNNSIEWNMNISRKLFAKNTGEIKLEAFDILNQRTGFDRYITSNYIIEKNYEVLKRYLMLKFTWNFTKNAATK